MLQRTHQMYVKEISKMNFLFCYSVLCMLYYYYSRKNWQVLTFLVFDFFDMWHPTKSFYQIFSSLRSVSTCARCDRTFSFNPFYSEKRLRHKKSWIHFNFFQPLRQIGQWNSFIFLLTNSVEASLEKCDPSARKWRQAFTSVYL